MASLQKVKEGFVAPVKLVKATKQDLKDRQQNPTMERKFQVTNDEVNASEDNYSEEELFEKSDGEGESEAQELDRIRKALKKENEKAQKIIPKEEYVQKSKPVAAPVQ